MSAATHSAERRHIDVGSREHDAGNALYDEQQHENRQEYSRERIVSEIERRMPAEEPSHEFPQATAEHRSAGQQRPPTGKRSTDERPDEPPQQIKNEHVADVHMNRLQGDQARIVRNAEPVRVQNDGSDRSERQDRQKIYPVEHALRAIPDSILGQRQSSLLPVLYSSGARRRDRRAAPGNRRHHKPDCSPAEPA